MQTLKDGERLDDLGGGLNIIQHKDGYAFTSDSVILANLARAKRTDRVVDIGTGSGIVAILVAAKKACREVVGVEVQARLASSAARSAALNGLEGRVKILHTDIRTEHPSLAAGSFDVAITNPPYGKPKQQVGEPTEQDIAKYEVLVTLADIIKAAYRLLKFGGMLFLVNKAARLDETLALLRENKLAPKELTLLLPKQDKEADTFVVAAKKHGRDGMRVRTLVLYNQDGTSTQALDALYKGSENI